MLDYYQKMLKEEELPPRSPFRINVKDGTIKWVEINAVLISWENKPALVGFLTDITERKQMEKAQRERDKEHQMVLDQVPIG